MLTAKDIITIGKWLEANFVGDFHVDFVKGFEGTYILISTSDEVTRHAYNVEDILKGIKR